MRPEADDQAPPQLRPWPPPQDGYDRILKPDRREARRRPLRRWQVAFVRVTLLSAAAFSAAVLAAGPSASLWRGAAIAVATSELVTLALCPRQQLRQLVGLRPPAGRDNQLNR